jgi:hypothetical protein
VRAIGRGRYLTLASSRSCRSFDTHISGTMASTGSDRDEPAVPKHAKNCTDRITTTHSDSVIRVARNSRASPPAPASSTGSSAGRAR